MSLIYHTQNFMESEGIVLNEPEPMPVDPYTERRKNPPPSFTTPSTFDRMQQFLTMDRKVNKAPSVFLISSVVSIMFLHLKIQSIFILRSEAKFISYWNHNKTCILA